MRTAHREPPVQVAGSAPRVASATGLGVAGGAGIQADTFSHGYVAVIVGRGAETMGGVELYFPEEPPPMFVTADDEFGTLIIDQSGHSLAVMWTQAALIEGTRLRINFELE